jgi:chromosome transmission fidelity protein 8
MGYEKQDDCLSFKLISGLSLQVPILIIGNHYLEGKRVALKKPLAILNKDEQQTDAAASMELDTDQSQAVDYRLAGVIKFKYIFKNRPKPL